MRNDKEYLNDIYQKYDEEKSNIKKDTFYNINVNKTTPSVFKNVAAVFLVLVLLTTVGIGGSAIIKNVIMTPVYIANQNVNGGSSYVWCGTFQLVWNDLMDQLVGGPVAFADGESDLANELNKQKFTVDMLNEDSYYKTLGRKTVEMKSTIEKAIKQKFNEKSKVLDDVTWDGSGYVIYAMLKKEFNFLKAFDNLEGGYFANNTEEKVKYFGINENSKKDTYKNVEILFYNSVSDFAVKLLTKENEEVILYRLENENANVNNIEELYNEVKTKSEKYKGDREFKNDDELKVPFMKVDMKISYDELCNRLIVGTDFVIEDAIQTIEFELDNKGGRLVSEAIISTKESMMLENSQRKLLYFDDTFAMFLKEADKEKPYFAMKVSDNQMLVKE